MRTLASQSAPGPSCPLPPAVPPGREDALALARLVDRRDHWRLFPDLQGGARYLDIETTGLEPEAEITVVGVSDGRTCRTLTRGLDLTRRRLAALLAGARILVTFNGARFDLPRLEQAFPGLSAWELPHFDLAECGRQVGLRGGLKALERSLGQPRPQELDGLDGAGAVRLWYDHQAGDRTALELLLRYCRADVEALVPLAARVHRRLRQDLGETQASEERIESGANADRIGAMLGRIRAVEPGRDRCAS